MLQSVNQNKTNMKKVLFVLAITALTACGASGLSEAEKAPVDTTSLGKDTTKVEAPIVEEDKTINQELKAD